MEKFFLQKGKKKTIYSSLLHLMTQATDHSHIDLQWVWKSSKLQKKSFLLQHAGMLGKNYGK